VIPSDSDWALGAQTLDRSTQFYPSSRRCRRVRTAPRMSVAAAKGSQPHSPTIDFVRAGALPHHELPDHRPPALRGHQCPGLWQSSKLKRLVRCDEPELEQRSRPKGLRKLLWMFSKREVWVWALRRVRSALDCRLMTAKLICKNNWSNSCSFFGRLFSQKRNMYD